MHQLGDFFFCEIADDDNHRTIQFSDRADDQFVRLALIGLEVTIVRDFILINAQVSTELTYGMEFVFL